MGANGNHHRIGGCSWHRCGHFEPGRADGHTGQKCSDIKVLSFRALFPFFFSFSEEKGFQFQTIVEDGRGPCAQWKRQPGSTQDPSAHPHSKSPWRWDWLLILETQEGSDFSLPFQPCPAGWVKPEFHRTPGIWKFPDVR